IILSFLISIVLLSFIKGINASNTSITSVSDEIDNAIAKADVDAYFDNTSEVLFDGIISLDEYAFNKTFSGIDIFVEHNKTHLFYGVRIPTTGWVAIGFNDLDVALGMADADFKLASVVNNIPYAVDAHSCNPACGSAGFGQPLNDTSDDIASFNGTEDTETTFEFLLPFNSSDSEDYSFGVNSSLTTFVAYGNDGVDELSQYHFGRTDKLELYIVPERDQEIVDVIVTIELTLSTGKDIEGNEDFDIIANLTRLDNGLPIEGVVITFYRKTSFEGEIILGSNITDANGTAIIHTNFTLFLDYNLTLLAKSNFKIEGNVKYLEDESSLSVSYIFMDLEDQEIPDFGDIYDPFQLSYLVPALTLAGVFISLTIIWTSFLYVLKLLISVFLDKNNNRDFE
ncbi:MAG: DOMON domain-containing protein, partial [Candidatus Kariarchaeaceae archaeon]